MKTRKHGNGLSHHEIVAFSNRLAHQGIKKINPVCDYIDGYDDGWTAACKYFAHELRVKLREKESNI